MNGEIKVQEFIDEIQEENYATEVLMIKLADLKPETIQATLEQFLSRFMVQVQEHNLIHLELVVDDSEVLTKIVLESGVINLPYANTKVVDNFFEELTQNVPLQINLIIEAETLNASGLHIDTLAAVNEYPKQATQIVSNMMEITQKSLQAIEENASVVEKVEV
ncbi:hypothetical protein [Ligilactobacillus ceti]|uniref:Uncharacterized protein n=1 Tax=Ligilactobacillus ceti DSM 22408 TaxID=1122146 RepID=A0A0R2KNT8_9LACO|nr:hypothetical protein [Ligilactobacillus ceti]KRN89366.1 hypothetical protein IV53_GL000084 [Ligilactobacillus ceti DSM 22408]